MTDDPTGITSDELIKLLGKFRVNDVYVRITDAEPEEQLPRVRVHGACYHSTSDTIEILAHQYYD